MDEVIDRSRKIYAATGGVYASSEYTWRWPSGASLRFRYLDKDADADEYHGQEFCVEVGTPVVMADGTQKAIELIEVGDSVLTLEGPRKVTRTVKPYIAPGVSVRVFDGEGRFVGVQRHPTWHPVMSIDGVRRNPRKMPLTKKWRRGDPDVKGWVSSDGTRVKATGHPVLLHAGTIGRRAEDRGGHWRHMYSGEWRPLKEGVAVGGVVMAPCGSVTVADITVQGANHYITATGLISSQTWQAFDELTNWASPKPIDKLMACLRSAEGVTCIRRSTGNPGGPGTKWVRDRYIKDRIAGEPFDLIPNQNLPDLKVRAVFIPSKLEDNPKLHIDDPTYESRLALSTFGDDALWKAWREGDWDVLVGRYFERFNEADNVYDPRTVELSPWMPKWISVDWGYEHPSAVYWYTWDGTNIWVHRELVRAKLTPVQLAYEIAGMTFGESVDAVYLSPDAFGRKMSERTIAQEMADVFRTFNIPEPAQADHDRVGGAMLLQQMFGERRLMISRDCPKLIECIPLCQRDTADGGNPEDVDKFDGDDAYDSLRYGVKTRPGSVRVPDEILIARRVTASDPQSRFMQTRVAQADLKTKSAAIVAMRRTGNWRREMAAN